MPSYVELVTVIPSSVLSLPSPSGGPCQASIASGPAESVRPDRRSAARGRSTLCRPRHLLSRLRLPVDGNTILKAGSSNRRDIWGLPSWAPRRYKAVRGVISKVGCLHWALADKTSNPPEAKRNTTLEYIAYCVVAMRRAARFRRRRAWASRDSSSRCFSRCSGWAATQRSGSKVPRAAVSPGP